MSVTKTNLDKMLEGSARGQLKEMLTQVGTGFYPWSLWWSLDLWMHLATAVHQFLAPSNNLIASSHIYLDVAQTWWGG